jgi:hypothetical protein
MTQTKNETDFDDLYGSKFFSVADLHGEMPRHKIGKVDVQELRDKDGTTKKRFTVYLAGVDKPLVLNKTNAQTLATAYGKDRENWKGAEIELYSVPTQLGEGVRLRPLKKQAAPGTDSISTGRPRGNDMDDSIPFAPDR